MDGSDGSDGSFLNRQPENIAIITAYTVLTVLTGFEFFLQIYRHHRHHRHHRHLLMISISCTVTVFFRYRHHRHHVTIFCRTPVTVVRRSAPEVCRSGSSWRHHYQRSINLGFICFLFPIKFHFCPPWTTNTLTGVSEMIINHVF